MSYISKNSLTNQVPRRKVFETNYKLNPCLTFGSKNKDHQRINKEVQKLEETFIQKLDMCQKRLDQYFNGIQTKHETAFNSQQLIDNSNRNKSVGRVNQTFGNEDAHFSSTNQKPNSYYQEVRKQEDISLKFFEHIVQPSLRSTSRRNSSQRRSDYNYNLQNQQTANKYYQSSIRPSSVDKISELTAKNTDSFSNSYRSSKNNQPIYSRNRRQKQNISNISYKGNSSSKYENIETINSLNSQISHRINRMMNSFK